MNIIMNDEDFREKGYIISTDKSLLDFESIYQYLNDESYWSKGIARAPGRRFIQMVDTNDQSPSRSAGAEKMEPCYG